MARGSQTRYAWVEILMFGLSVSFGVALFVEQMVRKEGPIDAGLYPDILQAHFAPLVVFCTLCLFVTLAAFSIFRTLWARCITSFGAAAFWALVLYPGRTWSTTRFDLSAALEVQPRILDIGLLTMTIFSIWAVWRFDRILARDG